MIRYYDDFVLRDSYSDRLGKKVLIIGTAETGEDYKIKEISSQFAYRSVFGMEGSLLAAYQSFAMAGAEIASLVKIPGYEVVDEESGLVDEVATKAKLKLEVTETLSSALSMIDFDICVIPDVKLESHRDIISEIITMMSHQEYTHLIMFDTTMVSLDDQDGWSENVLYSLWKIDSTTLDMLGRRNVCIIANNIFDEKLVASAYVAGMLVANSVHPTKVDTFLKTPADCINSEFYNLSYFKSAKRGTVLTNFRTLAINNEIPQNAYDLKSKAILSSAYNAFMLNTVLRSLKHNLIRHAGKTDAQSVADGASLRQMRVSVEEILSGFITGGILVSYNYGIVKNFKDSCIDLYLEMTFAYNIEQVDINTTVGV